MAKAKKEASAEGGPAKQAKYNSSGKRRATKAFSVMNDREKVARVISRAASLAKKADKMSEKDGKKMSSNLNIIVKPGGRIETMSAEEFNTAYSKAKAALSELKSENYGPATKALLNYALVDLKGIGGGGSKGFTAASVSDWEL